MDPLFPRWSNSVARTGIALGLITLAGVPSALIAWVRTPYVTGQFDALAQPVQFDHRHHVSEEGIDCRYCHGDAWRSPLAGVPAAETCMGCHDQIWGDTPLLAPVRTSYFGGAPLVWSRVHNLPDHVYFNHSAHVDRGVGCVSCHGRVDEMAQVYAVAPLTMGWCLDCHREPERFLRPLDRITDMTWKPARPQLELGRELRQRLAVQPPLNCSGCHR